MKIQSHIFALCIGISCTSPLAYSENQLPTSAVNIETATNAAQSVMVCRLTDLGWVDFRGPATTAYDEAKFEVVTTLKGEPIKRIVCSLLVSAAPLKADEKAPVVGENYVVIGDNKDGKFTLNKFVSATPDNLAKVQHLLSSSAPTVGVPDASATKAPPERVHSPTALEKTIESKAPSPSPTSPPSEEPTSSTPWSIILVLIAAATGLLWLLVKKRK